MKNHHKRLSHGMHLPSGKVIAEVVLRTTRSAANNLNKSPPGLAGCGEEE